MDVNSKNKKWRLYRADKIAMENSYVELFPSYKRCLDRASKSGKFVEEIKSITPILDVNNTSRGKELFQSDLRTVFRELVNDNFTQNE